MAERMIRRLTIPMLGADVRYTRVTLPMCAVLLDGVRYFRPGELPPPAGLEARSPWLPKFRRGKPDAAKSQG
jgi:hypothetical protein